MGVDVSHEMWQNRKMAERTRQHWERGQQQQRAIAERIGRRLLAALEDGETTIIVRGGWLGATPTTHPQGVYDKLADFTHDREQMIDFDVHASGVDDLKESRRDILSVTRIGNETIAKMPGLEEERVIFRTQ
jgi:hypothetical protein